MANPKPKLATENLKPFERGHQTHDEAVEKGRKGGIKSGKVRREKVLISQSILKFLTSEHKVKGGEKVAGIDLIEKSWISTFQKGGSPAVSLTKVMVEATEGNKLSIDSDTAIKFTLQIGGADEQTD